jgi:hypothetical protein
MSNFLIDEDTDLLAAEFVLGTLDSAERANAHNLLRIDHTFIAMVRIWERRFGELHLMVEPVDPDPGILRRIKVQIAKVAAAGTVAEAKPETVSTPPAAPAPAPPPAEPVAASPATPPVSPPPPTASPQLPKAANIELGNLTSPASPEAATAKAQAPAPVVEGGGAGVAPAAAAATPAVEPAAVPPASEPPAEPTALPASPVMFPPAAVPPGEAEAPAEVPPAEAPRPPDAKPEPVAKVAIPQVPPIPAAVPRPAERFPQRRQGRGAATRGPEITIDVIRSRGRWRTFGLLMSLIASGLVGLLAAWRFAPDSLPSGLQPGQFITAIGPASVSPKVETPPARPAPPTGQFDE